MPDSHLIFDCISAGVAVGWLIVGLLIKSNLGDIKLKQAENKAELIDNMNEVKQDLDSKHAENAQNIAVHTAEDNQRFDAISRTLARIDNKLDRINGHR